MMMQDRILPVPLTTPHGQPATACLSVIAAQTSRPTGAEAARRLVGHGPNRLSEKRGRGPVLRFAVQFDKVLVHVLLAAAVVSDAPRHRADTGLIRSVMLTSLQANGLSVTMTGDGMPDAPALRRADAGIAMGSKGPEAAKQASGQVLADDDPASIAAAVREWRTGHDNPATVISFELPTHAGEARVVGVHRMTHARAPIPAHWPLLPGTRAVLPL